MLIRPCCCRPSQPSQVETEGRRRVTPLDGVPVQPFCLLKFPGRNLKTLSCKRELELFKKVAVHSSLMCNFLLEQSNTATCVHCCNVPEDVRSPGCPSVSLSSVSSSSSVPDQILFFSFFFERKVLKTLETLSLVPVKTLIVTRRTKNQARPRSAPCVFHECWYLEFCN